MILTVMVPVVYDVYYEVEAESAEEARRMVCDGRGVEVDNRWGYTLNSEDTWIVLDEDCKEVT